MLLQTITQLPSLREFRCRRLEDPCTARRPLGGAPLGRRRRSSAVAAASPDGGSTPQPLPRLKVLRSQPPPVAPVTGPPAATTALPPRPAVLRVEPEAVAPAVKGQQLLRQAGSVDCDCTSCGLLALVLPCMFCCCAAQHAPLSVTLRLAAAQLHRLLPVPPPLHYRPATGCWRSQTCMWTTMRTWSGATAWTTAPSSGCSAAFCLGAAFKWVLGSRPHDSRLL